MKLSPLVLGYSPPDEFANSIVNMVDPTGMIGERPSNSCSQQSPTCVGPAYEVCKAACEVTSYTDSSIVERCTQNCCNTLNNIPSGPCVGGIVGDLMPSSEAATFIKSCNLGWLYVDKPNFLFSGDVVVAFSGVTSVPNAFITEVTYDCYDTPSELRTRIAANTYISPCATVTPPSPSPSLSQPSSMELHCEASRSELIDAILPFLPFTIPIPSSFVSGNWGNLLSDIKGFRDNIGKLFGAYQCLDKVVEWLELSSNNADCEDVQTVRIEGINACLEAAVPGGFFIGMAEAVLKTCGLYDPRWDAIAYCQEHS